MDPIGLETLKRMSRVEKYTRWLYLLMKPFLGGRVLEIGAGVGNLTKYLSNSPFLVVSDISDDYLVFLRERFSGQGNIRFQQFDASGDLGELSQFKFDTVICANVLEHIEDDRRALKNMYEVLEPGGNLLLIVPAHKIAYGTLDAYLGHFRRYEREDIVGKVEGAGFEIVEQKFVNFLGIFGWFVNSRILKRKLLPQTQLGFFRYLFPAVSFIESKINPPFGLSYFIVGEKSLSS